MLFKEHADRLVVLLSEAALATESLVRVKTIEDLVRVADELSKPVMYQENEAEKREIDFYVVTEKEVYHYQLKDEQDMKEPVEQETQPPVMEA